MHLIILAAALLYSVDIVAGEQHWALLAASSTGWFNYRHQADICHAYHVLRDHGFPEENIIVMMYDDIAFNPENPVQGNIINQPGGPNVYKRVSKDYTGEEVTPEVFLKVLTGDAEGVENILGRPGKVIKSGPDDRVFVNFADHGAPGFLVFPQNKSLMADDLHNAIKSMHKNKQYKQMVFYVEACESGSMFAHTLESDLNAFATTAANPDESSYACYYDAERGIFLGDVYSVNWMEDSDQENLNQESLQEQFWLVKQETNKSHVMEYGDRNMGSLKLADFQGNLTSSKLKFFPIYKQHPTEDAVPSEDVPLEILKRKLSVAEGVQQDKYRAAIHALLERKQKTEEFFMDVVGVLTGRQRFDAFLKAQFTFSDFGCYKESVRLVKEICPGMDMMQNDYALRKLRVLVNLCETEIPQEKIWAAIGKVAFETPLCEMSK